MLLKAKRIDCRVYLNPSLPYLPLFFYKPDTSKQLVDCVQSCFYKLLKLPLKITNVDSVTFPICKLYTCVCASVCASICVCVCLVLFIYLYYASAGVFILCYVHGDKYLQLFIIFIKGDPRWGARDNCLRSHRKNCEKYIYVCKQILYKQKCKYENLLKYLSAMLMCLDYFRFVYFLRIHLHFSSESEMKTHGKLIALRLILLPLPFPLREGECLACCSLTNLFQHINIYDNVLHRR